MALATDGSGPPRDPSRPGGTRRIGRPQAGVLVGPFVVAAGLTLAIGAATGATVGLGWVLLAVLIGIIAAAIALVVVAGPHQPARAARAANGVTLKPHQEAMGGDPLSHIHAVEAQGRRHQRPCTNCGTPVKPNAERCANCDHLQVYSCKGCRTKVRLDWTNCPECGRGLP